MTLYFVSLVGGTREMAQSPSLKLQMLPHAHSMILLTPSNNLLPLLHKYIVGHRQNIEKNVQQLNVQHVYTSTLLIGYRPNVIAHSVKLENYSLR